METLKEILDLVIPLAVALCMVLIPIGIIVGIVRLVLANKIPDPVARKRSRIASSLIIVLPVIGLFVLVSVWGFVNILTATFKQ